jgi:hypothetical protein
LFVTFTAPSFGAVHAQRRNRRGELLPCRPRDLDKRCVHGRKVACWKRHGDGERCLGEPVCPGCLDYQAQVIWNALAPELWRRTTEYVKRALAQLAGISRRGLDRVVRLSFCKVAEYQARGAVHFHAVIRLDTAPLEDDMTTPAPPPPFFSAELLADAVRLAAQRVAVPVPELDSDQAVTLLVRWGGQPDVRPIAAAGPGDLSAEAVAAYVAKYATKSTEQLGAALNRRITDAVELDELRVRPHVARLVRTAWELGGNPGSSGCGCAGGRTSSASAATGRPRAAATRPPSPRFARRGSPTRWPAGTAPSRWTCVAAPPRRRPRSSWPRGRTGSWLPHPPRRPPGRRPCRARPRPNRLSEQHQEGAASCPTSC